MSIDYQLVCIDCLESISLGKAVSARYRKQNTKSYAFDNLGMGGGENQVKDHWEPDIDGCEVLSHFLMLHRTHELRVLPDSVLNVISLNFPINDEYDDYSYTEFLNSELKRPRSDEDAEKVPADVIYRIQSAVK
jgi:hypothetical protein